MFKFKWQLKTADWKETGWMDAEDTTANPIVAQQMFQRLSECVAEGTVRNLIVESVVPKTSPLTRGLARLLNTTEAEILDSVKTPTC